MAGVVAPVPGGLPPSSQVRPSSIQGADVYGPSYVGGSTTVVGGTGGGGQIGGEGMDMPAGNDPIAAAPGLSGGMLGSGTLVAIAIVGALAAWSYAEGA